MSQQYYDRPHKRWKHDKILADNEFRRGSVLRILLRNFLTFDDTEVFPGARLNVVLGPNGSGKSSITHAICLACGGSPAHVGRSNDMTSFVKQGTPADEESFVEVDLLDETAVVTVRRTINAVTKGSKWSMDGDSCPEKDVKALMVKLSIDMGNLCHFMPQDRVGLFSRNTGQDTLRMTLQSIPDPDNPSQTLAEEQDALANLEETQIELAKDVTAKQAACVQIKSQLAAMQGEVERMRARQRAAEHLDLCKLRHMAEVAKEGARRVTELQEAVAAAEAALSAAEGGLRPLQATLRGLKTRQAGHEATHRHAQTALDAARTQVATASADLEQLDIQVDDAERNLKSIETSRRTTSTRCTN